MRLRGECLKQGKERNYKNTNDCKENGGTMELLQRKAFKGRVTRPRDAV